VGLAAETTLPPAPETMDQAPVPIVGVFPASVVAVAQMVWSGPAAAVVGFGRRVITTSSVEAVHGELAIVQRKV
jgi:hypothetical protein